MFARTTETAERAAPIAAPAPKAASGEVRIVVVDDRQERRDLMRYVLEWSGPHIKVVGFATGADSAVEAVGRLGADTAVVEIQLPVAEGLAVVSALRAADPLLRILVCSFHVEQATREAALQAGADAYLTKPLSPRDLRPLLIPIEPASIL